MALHISQTPQQQQQLTLTPSLRLALEILRMPLAQLQAYLSQQLEENPLLEHLEESPDAIESEAESPSSKEALNELDESFAELWRSADGSPADSTFTGEEPPRQSFPDRPPSLQDHLLLQLRCWTNEEEDRRVAEALIGWLDADGYLRNPIEEVAQVEGVDAAAVERALGLIHQLDPPGVGARSLPECLLIQLAHLNQTSSLAARIVREQFELLAKRKFEQLAARLHVSLAEVQEACRMIGQLDPKPARNFARETVSLLSPDLIMQQMEGEYLVELNDEELPRLSFSRRYRTLLRDPSSPPEAKEFIRGKIRQAVWLLKAINQRHTTLLAIGRCVIELERDYFAFGVHHLKALTQEEIARLIGCHPSTVSRAIAGKTIQTPYGILPLEYFFGGGIAHPSDTHRRLSPRTIQAELASLIASEDASKSLSDQALVKELIARGYPVARRTVAKYRTTLKILPAHLRKRPL